MIAGEGPARSTCGDRYGQARRRSQIQWVTILKPMSNVHGTRSRSRTMIAIAAMLLINVAGAAAQSTVEEAKRQYEERQARIRCAEHPDEGCLTRPETENEKAQREYRERQRRIYCEDHPDAEGC